MVVGYFIMVRFFFYTAFFVMVSAINIFAEGLPKGVVLHSKGYDNNLPEQVEGWEEISVTRAYIPEAIDLSESMPPPISQEGGSCVSFAAGYAVRGYYSALEKGTKPGDPNNTPSAAFLHSQIRDRKEECKKGGSTLSLAIGYLQSHGALNMTSVPTKLICDPGIVDRQLPKNEYSVIGGRKIFDVNSGDPRPSNSKIDAMKQTLAKGDPVMIGVTLYKADPSTEGELSKLTTLELLGPYDTYAGSLSQNYGDAGGHAMAVVGYDERKQAFRVQNSWGTDWADSGYFWMTYEAMKRDAKSAFVMKSAVTPPVPVPRRPGTTTKSISSADDCSIVRSNWQIIDGKKKYVLGGFAESYEALKATPELQYLLAIDEVDQAQLDNVAIRPWPVCEAMLTLNEQLEQPMRPAIRLAKKNGQYVIGDVMSFEVETPNFPSFLYLVYIQTDGTVVNLLPRHGVLRKQLAAKTVIKFGDGEGGRQKFVAAAPAGGEAIIAIAARSPLEQLEELEREGNGQFRLQLERDRTAKAEDRLYLSTLRTALADRPDAAMISREVSADLAYIKISEK